MNDSSPTKNAVYQEPCEVRSKMLADRKKTIYAEFCDNRAKLIAERNATSAVDIRQAEADAKGITAIRHQISEREMRRIVQNREGAKTVKQPAQVFENLDAVSTNQGKISFSNQIEDFELELDDEVNDNYDVLALNDVLINYSTPCEGMPLDYSNTVATTGNCATYTAQVVTETSSDYEIEPLEKPNLPKEKRVKLTKSQVELFATDVHFPFEDKTGWELFVQVARETAPDILWLNGDIIDGFSVAQWDKDPNTAHENNIQFEFDYCRAKLEELRAILPNAKFYFKEGNHETRLQRFLNKNAPALRCLKSLTVPFNLELERLEIEWIDNNDKFKLGELWHFHGNEIGGGGVNVALAKLRKIMANCIFGHYHIEQSALMRKYDGSPIGSWAIASLCDFNQDYVHHAETWSQGFARIEYLASGLFHVQPTQILRNGDTKICRVDGHWFEKAIQN